MRRTAMSCSRAFGGSGGFVAAADPVQPLHRYLPGPCAARHHHHYLVSDQVNGDWAVWERCKVGPAGFTNCNVIRYRISTRQTVRLPSFGRQAISPSVTSDGTVYLVLDGTADSWMCGNGSPGPSLGRRCGRRRRTLAAGGRRHLRVRKVGVLRSRTHHALTRRRHYCGYRWCGRGAFAR